ncbi:MAG: lactate racemase domain-containing protein [Planctomyces sp.]
MDHSGSIVISGGTISAPLSLPASSSLFRTIPEVDVDFRRKIEQALNQPLDLPSFSQCAVPGDRIVIAVDPETPFVSEIITQCAELFHGISSEDIRLSVLLPRDVEGNDWSELRSAIPESTRNRILFQIHDPDDQTHQGYLASSAGGERVYLNRLLLEADLIVTVGVAGFDSALGYRGTTSVVYPSMSDSSTNQRMNASGHPELTPDQARPARALVDEIGWLLGTQIAVQIVPDSSGGAGWVLTGTADRVQQESQNLLNAHWRISARKNFDLVIVSVPAGGRFAWKQVGAALESVSRLVHQGGRIAVIADVPVPEGPGMSMLRRTNEPEDLLKPLRRDPPNDGRETIQLIQTMQKARVYLYSGMPPEIVEEMGMFAIESEEEICKLLAANPNAAIIPSANFSWCCISEK